VVISPAFTRNVPAAFSPAIVGKKESGRAAAPGFSAIAFLCPETPLLSQIGVDLQVNQLPIKSIKALLISL
jgi:hypothetical protein